MVKQNRVQEGLETPYPLKRYFHRRIIPLLVVFIAALLISTSMSTRSVLEGVYLQLAMKRAEGIAQGVQRALPGIWEHWMAGQTLASEEIDALALAFSDEQKEFKVTHLKVYDKEKIILYADDRSLMGQFETGAALADVLETGQAGLVSKTEPDGTELYELYVPFTVDGHLEAVFELYEPVSNLNLILFQALTPVLLYPGILFLVLTLSLWVLIRRAQGDIDTRTHTINSLRQRLESLVSQSAVRAVRDAGPDQRIASQYVDCTLLYSDIRDFTGFSEKHSPAEVVAFLNDLMGLQVEIILRHGGDVDKMIGDAVLARFQDQGMEQRALAAAVEIQTRLPEGGFPRGIGIGIYSGRVIAGGIGLRDRLDYTIIGDTVNVSARLCSLAKAGQVVADSATLDLGGDEGFGPQKPVMVKGRTSELLVRIWPA